MTDNNI